MSDPNVNESIEFRVRLNEKEEGEEYNTTSCFISINDSGSYEPYCLVEQRGQLHLYNTGSGDIRTPATLREALVLVAEDTPRRRSEAAEARLEAIDKCPSSYPQRPIA